MDALFWCVIFLVSLIMVTSVLEFIRGGMIRWNKGMKDSRFSSELFYTLMIIYVIVLIGFGLLYFMLSLHQPVLVDSSQVGQVSLQESMFRSIYFSGVTLLTIGYGDLAPIGVGRLIALIQALIGYVLPTAFVLRIVQGDRYREKGKP